MRGMTWHYCVAVCSATLLMGAAGAQAATPAAEAAKVPTGQVWAAPSQQPWDSMAATGTPLAKVLNQSFRLSRTGEPGERHWYRFSRENLILDRQGRPLRRELFTGTVCRTLVHEKQPGVWAEKMTWERFGTGESRGPDDLPIVKDLPGAAGFTFDFFPPTFDYLNPPGDYSKLGNPMQGYSLKVVMMDVAGFDALLMSLRSAPAKRLQIGDTVSIPRWQEGKKIKPGPGAGVGGSYQLGLLTVSFAGFTRRNGEPCALIWFSAEGNEVTQDVENPQITLHMKATEYFRGTLAASIRDGHIVAGELWGPLPMRMTMSAGGGPAAEQPVSAIMQQVSLCEIPAPTAEGK